MKKKRVSYSRTRPTDPETGKPLYRDVRPFEYRWKDGPSRVVMMPGWYPIAGDGGIFTSEDLNILEADQKIAREEYERSQN